jgi:ATP-dependent exoDNAse (exonuclease V) beta subunit
VLAEAFFERGRRRFRRWIESAWLRLGGPATLAEETDLDNVRACFELLDELDAAGDPENVDQLTRHVAELYAAPDTGAGDALQIMTIHKAKGLEFDVVVVPGLDRLSRRDPPKLLRWAQRVGGDGSRDLLLAPIRESGVETSPIYEFLKSLEDEKQAHEEARLLYVAATRARQQLHLVGTARTGEDGAPAAPHPRSLLSRLWPAIHGEFVRVFAAGVEDAGARSSVVQAQRGLRRLPVDWVMPEAEAGPVRVPTPLVQAPLPGTDIEFEWAGRTIQHVGTAFHRCVRLLGGEPDSARVRSLRRIHEVMLRDLGVPAAELPAAADEVEIALLHLVGDARGRWLLDPAHAEAREEYSLSGLHQGQLISVALDRTFVAEDGTRWIVDYKTSRHEGPDLDAFLDREQSRYRGQLERYAALMRGMDERPIRLGLYFPLLTGWREWGWDG